MQLTVEKLIYGGDGLARLPQEPGVPAAGGLRGKAVFLPFVLAGERVEATLVENKPGFARARVDQVLAPSPLRQPAPCPYFGECGGCHYQHTSYPHQLEIKSEILRETLARLAKVEVPALEVHASPPWNYRNRTRMKLRAQPFAIGYHKFRSHSLLPVRECPISSPLINRGVAAMWKFGEAGRVPQQLVEIEFFADAEDQRMLVELTLASGARLDWPALAAFAGALRAELEAVAGVSVFRSEREGVARREDSPQRWKVSMGAESLTYASGPYLYRVGAGSFFQTNRFLTAKLLSLVTENRSGGFALDLYAGTGLFSLPLSKSFREVAAVEAAPLSFLDLTRNAPPNVKTYRSTTEKFLAGLPAGAQLDYVVVDPPRGGLGEKLAAHLAACAAPRLTYVSCDPATLARDLRVLRSHGYEIEAAHLVDLFPQTFHIETVLHLAR